MSYWSLIESRNTRLGMDGRRCAGALDEPAADQVTLAAAEADSEMANCQAAGVSPGSA